MASSELKLRQLVQIIGRPTRATDTTWESWRDKPTDTTDTGTHQQTQQALVQMIGRPTRATDTTSSWESWRDTPTDTEDKSTDTTDKSTDISGNDRLQQASKVTLRHQLTKFAR